MKDATIEIISSIKKHPNADKLEIATILGFNCVTQHGFYKAHDKIIYIRPDAVLPETTWAAEYRKYSPIRIKAVQLRNVWSEGIIVPFSVFDITIQKELENRQIGDEVSELINVTHFNPPTPQDKEIKVSILPNNVPVTDEVRIEEIEAAPYNKIVDITLKIDGKSTSFYYDIDKKYFGMLSRNSEMKSRYDADNIFQKFLIFSSKAFQFFKIFLKTRNQFDHVCEKYQIKEKLIAFCEKHKVSLVIRGEMYGVGIQSHANNPHAKPYLVENENASFPEEIAVNSPNWSMFSTYLMKDRRYVFEKESIFHYINVAKELQLPIVPIIEENVELTVDKVNHYSTKLKKLNNVPFEGVVVKHLNGSFKILNKTYDSAK